MAAAFALLWLTHTQALYFTNTFAGMMTFPVILVLTTIGCSLSYKRTSQKPSEHPGNKFLGPQEQRTGMCEWSHSDKICLSPCTSVYLLSCLPTTSILILLPRITTIFMVGSSLAASACLVQRVDSLNGMEWTNSPIYKLFQNTLELVQENLDI